MLHFKYLRGGLIKQLTRQGKRNVIFPTQTTYRDLHTRVVQQHCTKQSSTHFLTHQHRIPTRTFFCSSARRSTNNSDQIPPPLSPRAAFVVIGNEILNGSVQDTNTAELARFLFDLGVRLHRVEVIGDEQEEIINTLRRVAGTPDVDLVFTSGGIGPTHDDITYESIAAMFDQPVELHEPTVARMRTKMADLRINNKDDKPDARLKMAMLPSNPTHVHFGNKIWVPLVQMEKILVLPGVPQIFSAMLADHKHTILDLLLHNSHSRATVPDPSSPHHPDEDSHRQRRRQHHHHHSVLYKRTVWTPCKESSFAAALEALQSKYAKEQPKSTTEGDEKSTSGGSIEIGSYPRFGDEEVRGLVTVIGRQMEREVVDACAETVRGIVHGEHSEETLRDRVRAEKKRDPK
eukprot:Nk52_evm7s684 gene=Nk52_evmTU7s684